jgi:hypothetical protein
MAAGAILDITAVTAFGSMSIRVNDVCGLPTQVFARMKSRLPANTVRSVAVAGISGPTTCGAELRTELLAEFRLPIDECGDPVDIAEDGDCAAGGAGGGYGGGTGASTRSCVAAELIVGEKWN